MPPTRPSEPVLAWLRQLISTRNSSTADLAARLGMPRPRLRKLLSGAEPMLLDDMLAISQALQISPTDMGLPAGSDQGELVLPAKTGPDLENAVDAWGNHAAQLLRVGFALGCDLLFTSDTAQLGTSGVPQKVLDAHRGRDLAIQLDAAYHVHNKPRFGPDTFTVDLSFDAVYTCHFPWAALKQVTFWPAAWEGERAQVAPRPEPVAPVPALDESEAPPSDRPSPTGRPHLRLLKDDDG